mmetsp:Transcript_26832/g.30890  ORF Transcript_26832/g.30890 Transcript_26832/m.30890 type:complete len:246 (+) Transcript_26832:174-911(+)
MATRNSHVNAYRKSKDLKFLNENNEFVLPDEFPDYGSAAYWNARYREEQTDSYDWLQPWETIKPIVLPRLYDNTDAEILVVGCGNSLLSTELYKEGYHNITNIDISDVVITEMAKRFSVCDEMEFTVMDATELEYPEECFDCVIDKGTMDSLLCSKDSFFRVSQMVQQIYRTLKPGGVYMMVSHGHPETRIGYLKLKDLVWTIEHASVAKIPLEEFKNVDESNCHYVYLCTKNFNPKGGIENRPQ